MTISSTTSKSGPYNGNGSTTVFAYDFKILANTEVEVVLTSTAGVETVKTLTTHYTVSGVGSASGNVTMITAPATGEKLTLRRKLSGKQELDLQNQGAYYAEDVETAIDRLTMYDLQQQEELDRCVKVPVSSSLDPDDYLTTIQAAEASASASASSASSSASSASTSASTATTQAGIATTQATNASNSATSASESASTATTQASNAAASAASALSIYGNTSAMNAAVAAAAASQSAAATSATNASNSATAASGSASTATTQASNAASSASTATTQAGIATTQAGIATTKAGDAATSAAAALVSQNAAAASAAALPNGPATGTGNAPIWNGSAWVGSSVGTGDMVRANNLSDLTNAATARSNLGLGTAATLAVGTSANNIVQLDASAKLPAVDGSQLTNLPVSAPPAFKNLIIGGDFTTNPWQRGTTVAATNNKYNADRFVILGFGGGGAANVIRTADSPTVVQAGAYSTHCLHVDVTTADTSIATNDIYVLRQSIEGVNCASLGWGNTGAQAVTLSFWVKSTKTGAFSVAIYNSAYSRSVVAEYTVSASNTWEKKTVTFSPDTAGTWLYDTGVGMHVVWTLAAGTDYRGSAGLNTVGTVYCTTNQVNAMDSTSNDFKLALVQLEAGSSATAFEALPADVVLARCLRYYYAMQLGDNITGYAFSATLARCIVKFPVPMRSAPTQDVLGSSYTANRIYYAATETTPTSIGTAQMSTNFGFMDISVPSSLTAGQGVVYGTNAGGGGSTTIRPSFSSEL